MRTYAIGDIHGQLGLLRDAHERIAADRAACDDETAPVIHLGDLCDRGPDTRGVIELLLEGIGAGAPWIVLKGNHDRMFQGFLETPDFQDPRLRPELGWLDPRLGGTETLRSYGVEDADQRASREVWDEAQGAVPEAHLRFLQGLPLMHVTDEIIYVHAGIRPGVPLDRQVEDDLVWIRDGFLNDNRSHGRLVVHGHTVVERATHFGNRVDLDTGAGYGDPMTAAVIEGRDVYVLEEDGRRKLRPPY
ncbi:serine/threonine protein phosphatase 1 [Tranquillimonas rosea]|uniref:Serine/threonine protein phosphatase 1 n=1 Tax=Tranquillimonas rosea TaxID=641238 RepID=A0A1H9U7F1_9RHOB|nr:metallophosphoesterase family protein [Tranquillimonas rosea]SES05279.1 serine/threonine protein phosphatase 1 [Tranquillimonas rosea]